MAGETFRRRVYLLQVKPTADALQLANSEQVLRPDWDPSTLRQPLAWPAQVALSLSQAPSRFSEELASGVVCLFSLRPHLGPLEKADLLAVGCRYARLSPSESELGWARRGAAGCPR